MATAIQILAVDMVATAVDPLQPGDDVRISGVEQGVSVAVKEAIPSGHKLAVRHIAEGEHILKYGEVIGVATEDIPVGHWVHVHNCRGVKARRFEK